MQESFIKNYIILIRFLLRLYHLKYKIILLHILFLLSLTSILSFKNLKFYGGLINLYKII
jgi:hypothetical protein